MVVTSRKFLFLSGRVFKNRATRFLLLFLFSSDVVKSSRCIVLTRVSTTAQISRY